MYKQIFLLVLFLYLFTIPSIYAKKNLEDDKTTEIKDVAKDDKKEKKSKKNRRSAKSYVKEADKLLLNSTEEDNSNLVEAKELYLLAIEKQPKTRYIFNLSAVCVELNQYDEAATYLEKIYKKFPKNILIKEGLAYVYFRLDRFDEAITICDTVLKKDPFSANLLTIKATALAKNGDLRGAVNLLREAYIITEDKKFRDTIAKIYYLNKDKKTAKIWFGDEHEEYGTFEDNLKEEYDLYTAEERAEMKEKASK